MGIFAYAVEKEAINAGWKSDLEGDGAMAGSKTIGIHSTITPNENMDSVSNWHIPLMVVSIITLTFLLNDYGKFFINIFRQWDNFHGRTGRKEFIFGIIIANLISIILITGELYLNQTIFASSVFGILLIIPGISLAIRRLHDSNHSAWWLLLALIPILGWFWLLFLYLTVGDKGENSYKKKS